MWSPDITEAPLGFGKAYFMWRYKIKSPVMSSPLSITTEIPYPPPRKSANTILPFASAYNGVG